MRFDKSGKYLSLGDKAGRIIIFEAVEGKKKEEYDYFTEFQSHVKEFDALRSMEIEEEITGIEWLRPQGRYLKMVTTNNKNIKLWKIFDKVDKKVAKSAGRDLAMPRLQSVDQGFSAQLQLAIPPRHLGDINSVSSSNNGEYLLSSDEAQTFLWSLEKPNKPFMVGDMLGGEQLEEQKESITCSKMHPTSDNVFLFGTNKGSLKLCDMRQSAVCDGIALNFKNDMGGGQKNFLTEMISGYSSAIFSPNSKFVISRDCLTVKIWDICNAAKPINTIMVQETLKSKLCDMFENDCMEDRFGVGASWDGKTILTGNYNNGFHLLDEANTHYELNFKKTTVSKPMTKSSPAPHKMDYLRKTMAVDYHPKKNLVAVASLNCFYTYAM